MSEQESIVLFEPNLANGQEMSQQPFAHIEQQRFGFSWLPHAEHGDLSSVSPHEGMSVKDALKEMAIEVISQYGPPLLGLALMTVTVVGVGKWAWNKITKSEAK